MFCKYCGGQVGGDARFCEHCGQKLNYKSSEGSRSEAAVKSAAQSCTEAVSPARLEVSEQIKSKETAIELPMKWHRFLSCFALWAAALINLMNGFSLLNGGQYGGEAETVYSNAPALKTLDTVCGAVMLAAAVFAFFTAYSLLTMKKGAPKLLLTVYVIAIVLQLGYAIPAAIIIKNAVRTADVSRGILSGAGNALFAGIMLIVNMLYYNKREHLFVN